MIGEVGKWSGEGGGGGASVVFTGLGRFICLLVA